MVSGDNRNQRSERFTFYYYGHKTSTRLLIVYHE